MMETGRDKMLYRRFGRTNLQMPVFSTGGMRYQFKWQDLPLDQIPRESQVNLEATIRRSIDAGINHIETARGYGSSERQLGMILPGYPRHELIVQTKVSPAKDPKAFRADFLDSLARLRLNHVDLFSLHGINTEELLHLSIRPGGCLEEARRLQKEGYARHIGFSTHASLPVILEAIRTEHAGGFDYINLHWYFIFQRNWPAIEEATRRDMGVFIISPTDKGGRLYEPPEELSALTAPLHPIVFNDLFCLARPEVHTLSLGAAKPSDYDLHLEAVARYPDSPALLPPILARLEGAMADAVGLDFWRGFDTAMPRWEDMPGKINVWVIAWLHCLDRAWGMREYAKMRYNLLGNADHWFPGQNMTHVDDATLARALSGSPWKERLMRVLNEAHRDFYTAPIKRLSQST